MSSAEIVPASLSITLFGPLQVRVNGLPLPPCRSRKPLWLLAMLSLRPNRPVQRAWLAGTLWPDSDQSQAFANLRPALSELRSALAAEAKRLQSPDRHTLVLDLADADVDVLRFDAAVTSGTLSDLKQAVALYGGPLLEGCHEEWAQQEREARELAYLEALKRLGDASLAGGSYDAAAGYYQRAVQTDPWQEAARRGWMEALARNGDTNAALQVYREFVAFLRDYPKAVPDEQTSALYQRLRSGVRQKAGARMAGAAGGAAAVTVEEAPTAPPPRVQGYLPHPLTELVGREDERLDVALRLRRSRLVTLTGMGGIGKTRLAQEVASEVVREYKDGVWLVALDALSEGRLIIQHLGSALGLKEERGRPPLETVTDYLRHKRLLLVLDNCEHLLEESAQAAAHLLRNCGEVRILATSREPLGVTGETVWRVPALAVPDREHLPQGQSTLVRVLTGYESVQLFVERARAVQKGFALSGGNAPAVARVCQQLEGIPLALELAAARVRVMTVEQIASRLDNHLGLLTGGSRAAQARQQTLRATLDWSYALLGEAERALLRRLSVFAGGADLEAAEQVCAGAGIEEREVLDLLTSMVDKSLVVFEEREADEGGRYRLLEMVRQYAAEALQNSGEAAMIHRRHRDYFLMLAEEGEKQLRGAAQKKWLIRLDRERENFRGALAWCDLDPDSVEDGLRLAVALWRFWDMWGPYREGRACLTAALQREGAEDLPQLRARALNGAGVFASALGDMEDSKALHEASLAISRGLGDKPGCALPLIYLGIMAARHGDFRAARALYEESLNLWRELQDKWGIGWALHQLGAVTREMGDFAAARKSFEEALTISRELGDKQGIAWSLNDLGEVAFHQGDYASACSSYEESLAISRELDDKQSLAWSLHHLASARVEQGEYVRAGLLLDESVSVFRELGNRMGLAWALRQQGHVSSVQGDYKAAQAYCEESLTLQRQLHNKVGIAWALYSLGKLAYSQGNLVSARSLYQESLVLHAEVHKFKGIASCFDGLAATAWDQRDARLAALLWGAGDAVRTRSGTQKAPAEQADYQRTIAAVRSALGEEAFASAWEEGHAMTLEYAVAFARKPDESSSDKREDGR
jgi:predicted ATPase/DNA-binding SARP family transcriptional activator